MADEPPGILSDSVDGYYCDQCKALAYPRQISGGLICDCGFWWKDLDKQPRPANWVKVSVITLRCASCGLTLAAHTWVEKESGASLWPVCLEWPEVIDAGRPV